MRRQIGGVAVFSLLSLAAAVVAVTGHRFLAMLDPKDGWL